MKFFTTTALLAAMAITNTAAAPVVADDTVAVGNLVHRRTIVDPLAGSHDLVESKVKRQHDCDLDPAGCLGPDKLKAKREAHDNDPSASDGLTEIKMKRAGGPHGCDPEDPGCEGPDKLKAKRAGGPHGCDPEDPGCEGPDKLKVKRVADDNDPSGQF
ncbi:unnamed protein product [Zymoseptoria tritici ST99CH_3D7]|uniref:Uncharacterized protein n=1 Tax=Zymoseptoria tritici (strain ST99CH_3D7) TaxID=1276538 RepID=A0A1X7S5Z0_ZYMT9|nr:unnamed protein product [Zymoseptoria tritici ST99CH_3D7]